MRGGGDRRATVMSAAPGTKQAAPRPETPRSVSSTWGASVKLGRIWRDSPDGPVTRIVTVHPDDQRVVDLAVAMASRLTRGGAADQAARRLANAYFPASMSAAIGLGDAFLTAAAEADADAGDEATLAF